MAENQFVVDLGNVQLSADQRRRMNASIQSAVASELANFKLSKKIVLIPVDKWPKGPILDGIYVRDLGNRINDLIR